MSDLADNYTPAHKMGMSIFTLAGCLEELLCAFSAAYKMGVDHSLEIKNVPIQTTNALESSYEKAKEPPGYIHTQMVESIRQKWVQGYMDDPNLRTIWEDK